jgi:hypothetical protein
MREEAGRRAECFARPQYYESPVRPEPSKSTGSAERRPETADRLYFLPESRQGYQEYQDEEDYRHAGLNLTLRINL